MPAEHKSSIQVLLEPAELQLDGLDGSLLLSNLQSAFPSAVGLYYREQTNSKTIVKFDGRKFYAPEGGWHTRQYYLNLGSSFASTSSPHTYVAATKQFEKSVNVVQRMMEFIKNTDYERRRNLPICDGNELYRPDVNAHHTAENGKRPYENGMEQPKFSLEQELIDLANLNAGKDAIIASQRNQLKLARKELENQKRKLADVNNKLLECEAKCTALNYELELFRSMGKEQENMCGEVKRLEKKLYETEKISEHRILELENALTRKRQRVSDLIRRIEDDNNRLSATELKLKDVQRECKKLQQTEADVRANNKLKIEQLQNELDVSEKSKQELLMDNLRIHQLNEQLHYDAAICHEEREKIEREGKENLMIVTRELMNKNLLLEEQIESQRQQIIDYSSVVESMARENRSILEELKGFSAKKEHT